MMDADEQDVFSHLKSQPESQFIPAYLICRHAGGKHKYRESPDWAKPALLRLLARDIVEVNDAGAYRLKTNSAANATPKRWVSPQIAAILKQSGRNFDPIIRTSGETDAPRNKL
jgi:hypothetical protein